MEQIIFAALYDCKGTLKTSSDYYSKLPRTKSSQCLSCPKKRSCYIGTRQIRMINNEIYQQIEHPISDFTRIILDMSKRGEYSL